MNLKKTVIDRVRKFMTNRRINIVLTKEFYQCFICNFVMCTSDIGPLRTKKRMFRKRLQRRMEKINWKEMIINKEVTGRINDERKLFEVV